MANSLIDRLVGTASGVHTAGASGSTSSNSLLELLLRSSNNSTPPSPDYPIGNENPVSYNSGAYPLIDTLLQQGNGHGILDSILLSNLDPDDFGSDRKNMIVQWLLQLMNTYDQRKFDQGVTEDQRKYEWWLLNNQRTYDSPLNQMMRLMSTGMSRDAAIAAITASGAGAGAGASQPVQDGFQDAPSPTGNNDVQNGVAIAGAVFDGIGALANVMNSGVSLAQGIETVKGMQIQNALSGKQLSAYNNVESLSAQLGAITSNPNHALYKPVSGMVNLNDLPKLLQDHIDDATAQQILANPAYTSVFSSPMALSMANDHWKNINDSRHAGKLYEEFVKQQELTNAVKEMDLATMSQELVNMGKEGSLLDQKLIAGLYEIAMLDEQMTFNAETHDTRVKALEFENNLNDYQGRLLKQQYELNEAGMPILKQCYLEELGHTLAYWQTINDPKQRAEEVAKWKRDAKNANMASYLEYMYQSAAGNFASSNKKTWFLLSGFKAAGAIAALPTAGDVVNSAKTVFDIGKTILTGR